MRIFRIFRLVLFAMLMFIGFAVVASAGAFVNAPTASQVDFIGSVKTVSGDAYLIRAKSRTSAAVGDHLYQGDTLVTASSSSIGVIFRDDTILSLGPKSEVRIDEFVFNPADDAMAFLANVGKGTAQFITGQMSKIAPERMSVETPLATIGIRGTRFLVKVD